MAEAEAQLKAVVLQVTAFAQNCSVVWCARTNRGVVVDPGGDVDAILASVAERSVTVERVLLTHGHLDHAGGAAQVSAQLGVPIEGPHEADRFLLDGIAQQAQAYGLTGAEPCVPDRWLVDGDTVAIGEATLDVYHTPGHSPGHVIFHHPASQFALVGDVLFQGSIGRSDLPGGNHATLIRSVTTKLWPLGDDVTFLPGHGPPSTFGAERRSNPFVGDAALGRGGGT